MDRSSRPRFNFVILKHPDDLKNEETQLRIRRLAMTEVGRARRKPKTKRERNEILLEFRDPTERLKLDHLGSGRTDPFCPYPIELDDSDRALLAYSAYNLRNKHTNFLTWCSLQPKYHPLQSITRLLVSCWIELCSDFPQRSLKLSKFPIPETERVFSFPG